MAANAAWLGASLPAYFGFRAALGDPAGAQRRLLRRYISDNADTAFGREHRFDRIDGIDAFHRHIPMRDYDGHAAWIDRIVAGQQRVLTNDRVTRLVPSSGSTRAAKLVPYTATLQAEFNRAIGPWIVDLYRQMPDLMRGCAYWSVTPVVQPVAAESSAIPVGFEDDSAYLGGMRKRLVDAIMAVPGSVRYIADIDEFRFVTLCHLLSRRDLRLISVWHPSFLDLLLDMARNCWVQLLEHVRRANPARAEELSTIEPENWGEVWPHLRLLSCWADAHAAGPAAAVRRRLAGVPLQPKGLLATEAFVSIPFAGAWPLAVRSHFFEFMDDHGRVLSADELRRGVEYTLLVTTGGGLWRYRLGDRIRCEGFVGRTPSIRFIGRQDLVVDRFGEKLSEGFVGQVIRDLLAGLNPAARFAMLTPSGEAPLNYVLFVEARDALPAGAAERLDEALCANPHYAHCRRLGQLGPARVSLVWGDAYAAYVERRSSQGCRIGDLKPVALDSANDWASTFRRYLVT
jgi:hypothetical protein